MGQYSAAAYSPGPFPRGPCDRKNSISIENFYLDRKFQSRPKISIPQCFYLPAPPGVTEKGSIKNFNPRSIARNVQSRRPRSNVFNPRALWVSSLLIKSYYPLKFLSGTEIETVRQLWRRAKTETKAALHTHKRQRRGTSAQEHRPFGGRAVSNGCHRQVRERWQLARILATHAKWAHVSGDQMSIIIWKRVLQRETKSERKLRGGENIP